MAASVDTPSPPHLIKEPTSLMASSSPRFSPASDKRFWSTLRSRVDALIDDRNAKISIVQNVDPSLPTQINSGEFNSAKRLKDDSLLLLRGFDSISQTLSQLSNNLDNTLQGARELAKPPTLTDIFHSNLKNSEAKEEDPKQKRIEEESKIGLKRKFDSSECSDENKGDDSQKENVQSPKNKKMMKKAKNEENKRLRDGFTKGIQPEEDDLVRLQLEALLAEKFRLANENANLVREN
ncbi:hypothetical protein CRYUN_Cryun20dG0073500 [Craigia yunnanensis]